MSIAFAVAQAGVQTTVAAQDRGAVIVHPTGLVLVVADGAGGLVGGAVAAERVVGAARARVDRTAALPDAEAWRAFLRAMDDELARDRALGETTALVLSVTRASIVGASVGDSGAWNVTPDGVEDLTERQHPTRLGTGRAMPRGVTRFGPWGTLVAASDGLWKYAPRERLVEAARGEALDAVADTLLAHARLPSGGVQDDVLVLVAR
jgi:serine/threonine protein phosphatase PrpC